jgi:hypothetical protein
MWSVKFGRSTMKKDRTFKETKKDIEPERIPIPAMVASTCTLPAAPWLHGIEPFPYKVDALPWPAKCNV